MPRVVLFEWTDGGHRPIYVRRLIESLRSSANVLLAPPYVTLDTIGDLGVEKRSIGQLARAWEAFGGRHGRSAIRRRGQANYRIVRYADGFVIAVAGERRQAEGLIAEPAQVLATARSGARAGEDQHHPHR